MKSDSLLEDRLHDLEQFLSVMVRDGADGYGWKTHKERYAKVRELGCARRERMRVENDSFTG